MKPSIQQRSTLFVCLVMTLALVTFTQQSAPNGNSIQLFHLAMRGGVSFKTLGSSTAQKGGYAVVQPSSGNPTPSGVAVLSLRQNGVLVGETGVPLSPVLQSGRVY